MQDVLKEVEVQEPRFISSLTEINGRYEGFDVVSPNEFEVVLYLNQMGVFNFVDDGSLPGMSNEFLHIFGRQQKQLIMAEKPNFGLKWNSSAIPWLS